MVVHDSKATQQDVLFHAAVIKNLVDQAEALNK